MLQIFGIVKHPKEEVGHSALVTNKIECLQEYVGGYYECVKIRPDLVVICNEEGRLRGLPYNCTVNGIDFCGQILVLGLNKYGTDFTNVPITFSEWKEMIA